MPHAKVIKNKYYQTVVSINVKLGEMCSEVHTSNYHSQLEFYCGKVPWKYYSIISDEKLYDSLL